MRLWKRVMVIKLTKSWQCSWQS